MKRYIEAADRTQNILFPAALDDYVGEDNAVRVIDAFVDTLDLEALGLAGRGRLILEGRPTTRRSCSSSTSTATSIASSPADGSNASRSAMSS